MEVHSLSVLCINLSLYNSQYEYSHSTALQSFAMLPSPILKLLAECAEHGEVSSSSVHKEYMLATPTSEGHIGFR